MSGVAVGAAVFGAGCGLAGTVLYLRDMRGGTTVPHRGSWLVWSVIAVVATLAHGAEGGGWSLVVLSAQAAGSLAILAIAVRSGVGGFTPGNLALLTVAGLGVAGWVRFSEPVAAAACAAVADAAGLVAIVPKIWTAPTSETWATYGLAALGGLLAVLSSRSVEMSLVLFPAYYCVANAAVTLLIVWRRNHLCCKRDDQQELLARC